jgi:ribosome-binding protein aMBF1 (putative translation factor)
MDKATRKRLERDGWKIGSVADFLQLTPEEVEYIELKRSLAAGLRAARERKGLSQSQLARQLGSSQSRVAKMEAGDPSVSIDLMVRSFLTLGVSRADLAKVITGKRR